MSKFSSLFNSVAAPALFEQLGEDVVYRPSGGTTRTIKAIVNRMPPQRVAPDGRVTMPRMTIEVRNDAVYGISSAELNAGGNDRLEVAYRPGTTAGEYGIYLPEDAPDASMGNALLTLDLR